MEHAGEDVAVQAAQLAAGEVGRPAPHEHRLVDDLLGRDDRAVLHSRQLGEPHRAAICPLIDIPRNAVGRKRAITKVDQLLLDATVRDWQGMAPAAEVLHFMHDLREPRVFLTYPPASTAAALELVYSAYPAATATAGGAAASTVTGNIDLPDEWANALRYYVLYRAWSKDAEYGGNPQLAAANLQLFRGELGEQLESAATVSPKS